MRRPRAFLAWLGRYLSVEGGWVSRDATFTTTGTLELSLERGDRSALLRWSVPAAMGGVPFRDGSVWVEADDADTRRRVLEQVLPRLRFLTSRRPLAVLEKRNREVDEVELGPRTISSLCPELLSPGETRWDELVFSGVQYRDGLVRLRFAGDNSEMVLALGAAEPAPAGTPIGRYGPCALTLLTPADGVAGTDDVCRYVGYVLSLSIHDGMRLLARSEPTDVAEDPPPDGEVRGDQNSPFLFDEGNNSGLLMNAIFQSRGVMSPIFHADRECMGFASLATGRTDSIYLMQHGLRPTLEFLRRARITDTTEMEAIMTGCEDRLSQLITESVRRDRPQLVYSLGTCVSQIIGDRVDCAMADAGCEAAGVRTICMETTLNGPEDNYKLLWKELVQHYGAGAERTAEPSVNLVGYGFWGTPGLEELGALLADVGVEPIARLVPTFDLDELERFSQAHVNLFARSAPAREAFEWAAPLCLAPIVEPPAPYGVAGTRAFLDAVLAHFGHAPVSEEWIRTQLGSRAPTLSRLRREAARHRIGIVLTDDHFRSPDPHHRVGVPWLALLTELGFGLDVFVLPAPWRARGRDSHAVEALEATLGADAHRVTPVESMVELEDRFARGEFELVYSEVLHDRRVYASGKVPISFLDLEMSFSGAVSTAKRLIRYARTPFYRRYGRHLGSPGWAT